MTMETSNSSNIEEAKSVVAQYDNEASLQGSVSGEETKPSYKLLYGIGQGGFG